MMDLAIWQWFFSAAVVGLAFAVRGGAGFGGGAIAVPLLTLVFPVQLTVPVVTILNLLSSVGHGLNDWRHIVWRAIWRVIPGSLIGMAAGIYALTLFDPQPLSRALGVFVVFYALYVLLFSHHQPKVSERWLLPVVGVVSTAAGLIGALFGGAAGPVYVIYLNALNLARDAFRVTITTIMLFQAVTRVGGYALLGLYDHNALLLLAAALPMMLVGSWLGVRVVRQFDQIKFGRAVGVVLLVSGLALIFR